MAKAIRRLPPSHIANPDPLPGTDNVYTVDLNFDGNFTECADPTQPGIKPIRDYLKSLPYDPDPNCQPGHFYMVNNDSPGFLPDGTVDTAGIAKGGSIPPINIRTIGEALNEKNISWAYYGGAYNAAVAFQHNPTNPDPLCRLGEPTATSATLNPTPTPSWATRRNARLTLRTRRTSSPPSTTTRCRPCPSSSQTACSTAIRLLRSSTCLKRWLKNIVDHLNANPELFA